MQVSPFVLWTWKKLNCCQIEVAFVTMTTTIYVANANLRVILYMVGSSMEKWCIAFSSNRWFCLWETIRTWSLSWLHFNAFTHKVTAALEMAIIWSFLSKIYALRLENGTIIVCVKCRDITSLSVTLWSFSRVFLVHKSRFYVTIWGFESVNLFEERCNLTRLFNFYLSILNWTMRCCR